MRRIRMNTDVRYALALGIVSTSLLMPEIRFPVLETAANPFSSLGYVFVILYLGSSGYPLVSVVLAGIGLYLLVDWTEYSSTNQRQIYLDTKNADARFNPLYSVDLQVANHAIVPDAPSIPEGTEFNLGPELKFPPTSDVLLELNG